MVVVKDVLILLKVKKRLADSAIEFYHFLTNLMISLNASFKSFTDIEVSIFKL